MSQPARSIVLYLHVHQPYRVRPYSVFDTAVAHNYFAGDAPSSTTNNRSVFQKVAQKSYLPTNKVLLSLLQRYPQFCFSLSISGTALAQMSQFAPEVLASFQALVATGRVEIVAETYHHSLAFFYDRAEFEQQVALHAQTISELFGYRPTAFRNTELAYNNDLAIWADQAGYQAILSEGWDPVLGWRSPNFIYQPAYTKHGIKLLAKNYRLSDDIAFRFGDRQWVGWPLTAKKFVGWLNDTPHATNFNIFMDYETFGEHQWHEAGIFEFLKHLPGEWLAENDHHFHRVTEATHAYSVVDTLDMPEVVTWADTERDLSAWLGNDMQQAAIGYIYEMSHAVLSSGDQELIEDWRKLQTSDHFYYMCTKWFNDGDIHAYFSPYDSPYDAFLYFMNALRDVRYRLMLHQKKAWQ